MKKITIDEKEIDQTVHWLMPWKEKTGGAQLIGAWEDRLCVTMMLKLVELWLTERNRVRLRKMLKFYHPVDQAAMCYALLIYALTGHRMLLKNMEARQQFKKMIAAMKADMPELMFSEHLKYMISRYGKKTVINPEG